MEFPSDAPADTPRNSMIDSTDGHAFACSLRTWSARWDGIGS
jgi:hypothetical protein